MTLVYALLAVLVACGALLVVQWWRTDTTGNQASHWPGPLHLLIGFATNFFDTLGIGSFAPTTAVFRLWRLVDDQRIPGTLIVGHAVPVITQALFFISVVEVDPWQMTALIVACVAGGWTGAGVVALLTRRAVQLAMGTALLIAALLMISSMIGVIPPGGTATAFAPAAFAAAIAASVVLGALLTIGIGNYAPSLIVFSLLGVDPRAAFPIMMGSGAFVLLWPACASFAPAASTGAWRSAMTRTPTASLYLIVLDKDDPSPLSPQSDEEAAPGGSKSDGAKPAAGAGPVKGPEAPAPGTASPSAAVPAVTIDFDNILQRVLALPMPPRRGPA